MCVLTFSLPVWKILQSYLARPVSEPESGADFLNCADYRPPSTNVAVHRSTAAAKPQDPLRLVLASTPTPASALYSSLAQAIYPTVAHQQSPDLASAAPKPKPRGGLLNVDTTLPGAMSGLGDGASSSSSSAPAPAAVGEDHLKKATSLIAQRFARLPIGSRLEVSPASWEIARDLARLLGGSGGGEGVGPGVGGAGLVVDYGDAKAFGRSWRVSLHHRISSFFERSCFRFSFCSPVTEISLSLPQGFRKHQVVDPLTEPGHTDLTANVDFAYLAEAMSESGTSSLSLFSSEDRNSPANAVRGCLRDQVRNATDTRLNHHNNNQRPLSLPQPKRRAPSPNPASSPP